MKLSWLLEFLESGARNLLRHKTRSLLTLLGVLFGVAAVITMMGIGEGAQRTVLKEISGLGLRNIIMESVQPPIVSKQSENTQHGPTILQYGITWKDVDQINNALKDTAVSAAHLVKQRIFQHGRRVDAEVSGVSEVYFDFFDHTRLEGRLISALDNKNAARVAVVSEDLAYTLHAISNPQRPPSLRIGKVYYDVVGVVKMAGRGNMPTVFIPYRTAQNVYGDTTVKREAGSVEFSKSQVGKFVVRLKDEANIPSAAEAIKRVFAVSHNNADVRLTVPLEILETKQKTQRILNLVLIVIAAISLVVGGIGIMNIMLAVVTERIPEIGLRRAIGATRRDILAQFLAETVTLSSLGGLLGCLLGIATVPLASRWTGWAGVITPWAVIISLTVSWCVGLVFGLAPAMRAARMDPVDALRHE